MYSKLSFGEVNCRIYGCKLSFKGTLACHHKYAISNHISKDIPPKNENFEYVYLHSNVEKIIFFKKTGKV